MLLYQVPTLIFDERGKIDVDRSARWLVNDLHVAENQSKFSGVCQRGASGDPKMNQILLRTWPAETALDQLDAKRVSHEGSHVHPNATRKQDSKHHLVIFLHP
ncbi:hypothetical protein Tdes44962_MAKER03035 [Teratosphaeria destructans]|uniref:Uncharacterized protein n=1 Tax=Teratosphaeria destructans TaxID=418781 RepID=A0A9W7SR46_9PEZI|nr:hypothetical protein Tdes44962_MAKER03035 [Teratosphaeria destructans]